MKDSKIIVFSPHPDDETFGCGGTIAKRLCEGFEVSVVLMTDGRHAYSEPFGIVADPTPEELKKIRKTEEERAMRILGLRDENLVFLDFEDGTLEQNREEAEKEVVRILVEHRPTEVYNVHEGDFHPDHRAASRIVENAIKKASIHTTQCQYSISSRYGRLGMLAALLLSRIKQNVSYVDISDFLPLKEKAMKEFRSQISTMSERQERPVVRNLQRFMRDKEVFFVDK